MMLAALLAAAATIPAPPPRPVVIEQARATVRIVSGAGIRLGDKTADAQLRSTQFRDSDGSSHPAKLVEFQ